MTTSAQPDAGEWLNVAPDDSKGTTFDSDSLLVALQRRANLDLSVAKGANDSLVAAGEPVDRKGDNLQNASNYTACHNAVVYAARDMVLAAAQGRVIIGDKEKPGKTAQFNADHVPDLVEVGGDGETGRDALWEIKAPTATKAEYKAGQGKKESGGTFTTNGHLYAFGNTDEQYSKKVFGLKGTGKAGDTPFGHTTGQGWVAPHKGHYHDAIHVRRNRVNMLLVERSGGINSSGRCAIRQLHQSALSSRALKTAHSTGASAYRRARSRATTRSGCSSRHAARTRSRSRNMSPL